ncbi:hypothetical protein Aglo01_36350 [Actinokineospora globicatena]|nr:hypothetical protein Aglo01_36350 [Actinokineospora globicatena]GLW86437.1 hypothetical protein Aglo02_40760 [Actinokineospora globicatena]
MSACWHKGAAKQVVLHVGGEHSTWPRPERVSHPRGALRTRVENGSRAGRRVVLDVLVDDQVVASVHLVPDRYGSCGLCPPVDTSDSPTDTSGIPSPRAGHRLTGRGSPVCAGSSTSGTRIRRAVSSGSCS